MAKWKRFESIEVMSLNVPVAWNIRFLYKYLTSSQDRNRGADSSSIPRRSFPLSPGAFLAPRRWRPLPRPCLPKEYTAMFEDCKQAFNNFHTLDNTCCYLELVRGEIPEA